MIIKSLLADRGGSSKIVPDCTRTEFRRVAFSGCQIYSLDILFSPYFQ